jgi:hypothetical protein
MRDAVNADTAPAAPLSTFERSGRVNATPFKGPFKGKGATGAGGDPRDCRNGLEALEREMCHEKARSRSLDQSVRRFYLDVIRRPTAGRPTRTLRWRHTSGRHTTWAQVEAAVADLPEPIRQRLAVMNENAIRLNAQAMTLRRQLRSFGGRQP